MINLKFIISNYYRLNMTSFTPETDSKVFNCHEIQASSGQDYITCGSNKLSNSNW